MSKPKSKTRAHETVTKIGTPFRGVFAHISWDDSGFVIGVSLSHQQKDFGSPITELIEAISSGLCEAIKSGP